MSRNFGSILLLVLLLLRPPITIAQESSGSGGLIPTRLAWQALEHREELSNLLRTGTALITTTNRGHVARLDTKRGKVVWTHELKRNIWVTPVRYDDQVIVAASGQVISLDLKTGKTAWTFDGHSDVYAQPLLQDGLFVVGTHAKNVHVLEAATGKEIARFVATDWVFSTSAMIGDSVFFIDGSGTLFSFSIANKTENWRTTEGVTAQTPVFAWNGGLYRSDNTGSVVGLDPATGAAISSLAFPGVAVTEVLGAVGDDLIVRGIENAQVGSFANVIARINLGTGAVVWSYARPDESILSQLSLANSQVVFGSESRLGILDVGSGQLVADLAMLSDVQGVAQDNDHIFLSTRDRGVLGLTADGDSVACPGRYLEDQSLGVGQARYVITTADAVPLFASSTEASQEVAAIETKCTVLQLSGPGIRDQGTVWYQVYLPDGSGAIGWVKQDDSALS